MSSHGFKSVTTLALAISAAFALSGCGGSPDAAPTTTSTASPQAPFTSSADQERAEALAQQERDLAAREAELALKEREETLARREAELKARQSAPSKPAAPAKAPVKTERVAVATAPAPAKAPPPAPIVVPAGTQLSIGLSSDLSTKTAQVGDHVDARLATDLMIDGRRAVMAGTPVRGSVTEVVSGSNKIGGVPTLAMRFDRVELDNGATVSISGHAVQQGTSETAKDTAKIVGGAAAGAIIGHQIDDDKGKIIGGLLGGAAGTVAAKKTGGEVSIPAGTVITVALDAPFEVSGS